VKFKKTLTALLTSIILTTPAIAEEPEFPPLHEVAAQVKKKREKEQYLQLFNSLGDKWKEQIIPPTPKPKYDFMESFCKNLLVVFGISADSHLSNQAVRQLRRKLISKAEEGSNFYANQIGVEIEQKQIPVTSSDQQITEIKKIEYNYISWFGLSFSPYPSVNLVTKLVGSFDPFKPRAEPKIKSEILISDHLEIYGEIWKEYTNHETKQHEWEIGINIDVLKLMDKFKK